MPEKDVCEKTLESYNDVFADIVNGLLFNGEQVVREDELEPESETSIYKADGKMREQRRDVVKYWTRGKIKFALFGLENQTDIDRDMVLRVINYDGAIYRRQVRDGSGKRFPVVTLVLYFGDGHWRKPLTLYDSLDIPKNLESYVSDYRINVFEICHLSDQEINRFRSDFKIVAHYFVHRKDSGYHGTKDEIRHVDEFFMLMKVLTRDKNFERDYNEGNTDNGGKTMDDFLTRFGEKEKQAGIIEGKKEGIIEGKKVGVIEGKKVGIQEGQTMMIQQAMKNGNMTVEQLSVLFNMPVEEIRTLSQMHLA